MVFINYAAKELNARIAYCGPAGAGKATSLLWIHGHFPAASRKKPISLDTESDRTLLLDLTLEEPAIRGFGIRAHLYTFVPAEGCLASLRQPLKGVDGIVLVCDSRPEALDANADGLALLRALVEDAGLDLLAMPLAIQYTKRDSPDALPVETLNELLNPRDVPSFEAIATQGVGVAEALRAVLDQLLSDLRRRYVPET